MPCWGVVFEPAFPVAAAAPLALYAPAVAAAGAGAAAACCWLDAGVAAAGVAPAGSLLAAARVLVDAVVDAVVEACNADPAPPPALDACCAAV